MTGTGTQEGDQQQLVELINRIKLALEALASDLKEAYGIAGALTLRALADNSADENQRRRENEMDLLLSIQQHLHCAQEFCKQLAADRVHRGDACD